MSDLSLENLAVFGASPRFSKPLPTGQIYTPDRQSFMDRLDKILKDRWFSNGGQFQSELETALAKMHQVEHVIAYSNASFALLALINHFSLPDHRDVVLPSFTYRGLPHIIQWAGKFPRFCDVDLSTHTMRAQDAALEISKGGVSAILAVNHVNAPADLNGLKTLSEETGIPVIYDSVYAIAGSYGGTPFGGNGLAEVFSLHATKLLNGFEGGYIATNDASVAETMRNVRNFGFNNLGPEIQVLGMNGKLNEIHAAMALASLEKLDQTLARNREIFERYASAISGIRGLEIVRPVPEMKSNNEMVLMQVDPNLGISRDEILNVLQAERALARPYFSPPLHKSKHCPPDLKTGPLKNTDALERKMIQLPTGAFVTNADVDEVVRLLQTISRNGAPISDRLRQDQQVTA